MTGMILGVDRANGQVTLAVLPKGQSDDAAQVRVRVQAVAKTQLEQRAGSVWIPASLSDFQSGQSILVRGTISGDAWVASRIRVGKRL